MSKKKLLVLVGILFSCNVFSQDVTKADSLKNILYNKDELADSISYELLFLLIEYSPTPSDIIKYSDEYLANKASLDEANVIKVQIKKGLAYRMLGDLKNSLTNLFKAVDISLKYNRPLILAEAYSEIANTYSSNNDLKNSLLFGNKAITIFDKHGKQHPLAINLLNNGYTYYLMDKYDSALIYYARSERLFEKLQKKVGIAYCIGNKALVHWKQGLREQAIAELNDAIEKLMPYGDQFGISDFHNQLGSIYLEINDVDKAIHHTETGLSIADSAGLKEQVRDAALVLSKLYENKLGDYEKALNYYKQYLSYKDSIQNAETTREIADLRTAYEVGLREKEISLLEKDKYLQKIYIGIAIILMVLFIVLFLLNRQRLKNHRLTAEVERENHNKQVQALLQKHEKNTLESMIVGRENERRRIAGELHNHLGNLLATIKVNVSNVASGSFNNIEKLEGMVDQAYNDVRNLSHSLNMGVSEDFGLEVALAELTDHLAMNNKLQVEFTSALNDCKISFEHEIVIYRLIQELVSNILKYAKASQMSIMLTCYGDDGLVNIMVSDNGVGFDVKKISKRNNGMGLSSMRDLIARLNGSFELDTYIGRGTTVIIDLPVHIVS